MGMLEGSIIAPTITCQATTKIASATHNGRALWSSASWWSSAPFPVAWAAIAIAQAIAIAATTGRGTPAHRPSAAIIPSTSSSLPGVRDVVVGLDRVATFERPHHAELGQIHVVLGRLRDVRRRPRDRREDRVLQRRRRAVG